MADEIELLITVVVSADGDRDAREACAGLLSRIGARIVESGDCSDEEPGCWSVTIGRVVRDAGPAPGTVALSRAVRQVLRELGPEYARYRVACEFPTAWTVIDSCELVEALVAGGERLLVEAWAGPSALPGGSAGVRCRTRDDPDEPPWPVGPEPRGRGEPKDHREDGRLSLVVDVIAERSSGAQWPSRAIASLLSRTITLVDCTGHPPMLRVRLDLGPVAGNPAEVVTAAAARLGQAGWSWAGWSRPREHEGAVTTRWSAAPTPPSGVAALELSVRAVINCAAPGQLNPNGGR